MWRIVLLLAVSTGSRAEDALFMFQHPANPQYFNEVALESIFPQEKILSEVPRMKDMPHSGLVRLRGFKPADIDVAKPIAQDAATVVKNEEAEPLKDISAERLASLNSMESTESMLIQRDITSSESAARGDERDIDIHVKQLPMEPTVPKDDPKAQIMKVKKFTNKVNIEPRPLDESAVTEGEGMEKGAIVEVKGEEKEEEVVEQITPTGAVGNRGQREFASVIEPHRRDSDGSSERPLGVRNPHAKLVSLSAKLRQETPKKSRATRIGARSYDRDADEIIEVVRAKPNRGFVADSSAKVRTSSDFDPWDKPMLN